MKFGSTSTAELLKVSLVRSFPLGLMDRSDGNSPVSQYTIRVASIFLSVAGMDKFLDGVNITSRADGKRFIKGGVAAKVYPNTE